MRITQNMMYANFLYNQQTTLFDLNKTTTQLSTGMKIDKMYDDPVVFTDTLRLDSESNTLTQVLNTSKNAQTFANNTDTTMNDMVLTLESFKTKLIQAASATNSDTSFSALADELEGLRDHLKDLANTSINGKYLFSGTAFDTMPIDDEGNYHGNDKRINAKIGNSVEVPYNIDGETLFEGIDRNYSKHIMTNVKHFNTMLANPEFVVEQDGKRYIDRNLKANGHSAATDDPPQEVSLSPSDEIRMLTGVNDIYDATTDTYSDGTSYFYLQGRKPDGETFSTKIALTNSSTIDDLMDRIGQAFGNNALNKAVDVSMNQFGQFEIRDTTTGKLVTDFQMVASDADEASIDDLVKNGDYIVTFTKSQFPPHRDIAAPTAQNDDFDNRVFKLNSEFRRIDNEAFAKPTDTIFNVLGDKGVDDSSGERKDLNAIRLTGTDTDGNSVDVSFSVDSTTTMQDLLDEIKNNFGDVDVALSDGKLLISDNTIDKDGDSKLSLTIDAYNDADGDLTFNTADGDSSLSVFAREDGLTYDKTQFNVIGRQVTSNVPQVDKNTQTYATEDTRLVDVSGVDDIDGKRIDINYTDKDGNIKRAYVTLRDTPDADGHLSTFTIIADDGTETTYDIFDNEGNKTPIHDIVTTTQEIDPITCELCNKTHTTKGITYKQLDDVIGMLVSNNLPANNDPASYRQAIDNSKDFVDVGLDDKGRLYISDRQQSDTNIRFEIHDHDTDTFSDDPDTKAPVFTFNANNAVTIDEAKVDIFHQLDTMIQAVRDGKIRADGDDLKDPRNPGIEAGIELIDHILDHVEKKHTEIGSISKSLQNTEDRTNTLIVHTETLKSDVIDVDMAEASLELQKLQLNYQAMLATISKVNNLSLVNYMK